ncbi:MAG: isopentenyl-diphosphate delta-isomerase [Saprospiraceae bacterium]
MEEKIGKQVSDRKQDHIDLAFAADMANRGTDNRFYYEPMLSAHPADDADISISFLGKKLSAPLWVSSMTGGTEKALVINRRLAASCAKFGLGMGLGSCRPLLKDLSRLADFDVRDIIGPELPLFANLGVAQVEHLINQKRTNEMIDLVTLLKADGLIVHINPLKEWLQPEGDRITQPPIETLRQLIDEVSFPIIVKEVGQGMGRESIEAVLKLPVAALELAAHGGTNFSKLELLRGTKLHHDNFNVITHIGHSIGEMISWINKMSMDQPGEIKCRQIIVSGGVKDFLDGYYWTKKLNLPSIYGQASAFLKFAKESQETLDAFIGQQINGLQLANAYLKVK